MAKLLDLVTYNGGHILAITIWFDGDDIVYVTPDEKENRISRFAIHQIYPRCQKS